MNDSSNCASYGNKYWCVKVGTGDALLDGVKSYESGSYVL